MQMFLIPPIYDLIERLTISVLRSFTKIAKTIFTNLALRPGK